MLNWRELVIWGEAEDDITEFDITSDPENPIDISEFTEISKGDLQELIILGDTGDGTMQKPEYSANFSEFEEFAINY